MCLLFEDVVQQYMQINMQQCEWRDHRDISQFLSPILSAFGLKVKSHLFKLNFKYLIVQT